MIVRASEVLEEYKTNLAEMMSTEPQLVDQYNPQEDDIIERHIKNFASVDFRASMSKAVVTFETCRFVAHIARTPAQKMAGLEVADSIGPEEGMLFELGKPRQASFHMGAVKFPIDIVFLLGDFEEMTVAKIVHNAQPGDMTQWSHPNIVAVLEVAGELCKFHEIKVGSTCFIAPRISSSSIN